MSCHVGPRSRHSGTRRVPATDTRAGSRVKGSPLTKNIGEHSHADCPQAAIAVQLSRGSSCDTLVVVLFPRSSAGRHYTRRTRHVSAKCGETTTTGREGTTGSYYRGRARPESHSG